jgi:CheY-like chemotaxis protein
MHFRFCWEHKNCSGSCPARENRSFFCWRILARDQIEPHDRCETCDYRRKWIDGEFSVLECVQRFERRRRPRTTVKVLVVDDEPYIRYALEETVTSNGFECIPAADGEEGLFLALETGPDLVITDVILPKVSGYELCHTLKTRGRTRHIPVIMLTVRATDSDLCEGERAGADAYLIKPFRNRELNDAMAAVLPSRPLKPSRRSSRAPSGH